MLDSPDYTDRQLVGVDFLFLPYAQVAIDRLSTCAHRNKPTGAYGGVYVSEYHAHHPQMFRQEGAEQAPSLSLVPRCATSNIANTPPDAGGKFRISQQKKRFGPVI